MLLKYKTPDDYPICGGVGGVSEVEPVEKNKKLGREVSSRLSKFVG
jgi:hypothetical protein